MLVIEIAISILVGGIVVGILDYVAYKRNVDKSKYDDNQCPHLWSQWKVFQKGDLLTLDGSVGGFYIMQRRVCDMCGESQIKKEEI